MVSKHTSGRSQAPDGRPQVWDNLLPLLWGWTDSSAFSNALLRRASGLKMNEVREVAETSELGAQYKCLECREPLETHGRDQYESRRVALASFLAHQRGTYVSTEIVCALLCDFCGDLYRLAQWEQIKKLRGMEYQEYLLTREWRLRREQKLQSVEHHCQGCEWQGPPLEVHHRCYDWVGDELLQDLTVYCRECHQRQHGISPEAA